MKSNNPLRKNCQYCNCEFEAVNRNQICCSRACSIKRNVSRAKNKEVYNRFMIFERDGFKCFYCGKSSLEDQANIIVEHIISGGKGRINHPSNLVTSCVECNSGKGCRVFPPETLERILSEVNKRNENFNMINYQGKFLRGYEGTHRHIEWFEESLLSRKMEEGARIEFL